MTKTTYSAKELNSTLINAGVMDLLATDGIDVGEDAVERMARYLGLVSDWNKIAGLVSQGDLGLLIENHLIDSLSLAPVIKRLGKEQGRVLDIGSGGGFPAIPMKLVLPDMTILMIERSERKTGFLIKAAGDLGLRGLTTKQGNFPELRISESPDVITARAAEKPEQLLRQVTRWMPVGSIFLVQSGEPKGLGPMFHVEHIEDEWRRRGLRRGDLFLVRRTM